MPNIVEEEDRDGFVSGLIEILRTALERQKQETNVHLDVSPLVDAIRALGRTHERVSESWTMRVLSRDQNGDISEVEITKRVVEQ